MQRLDILLAGNVIDKETHSFSVKAADLLATKYGFQNESLDMLITHLAMAHQRIKVSAQESPILDKEIIEEIKSNCNFEKSKEIMSEIESLADIKYPENEREFILAHIINILDI
ncbi:MAG: PRD domain-containing protein [Elusimicrobiota bacterium]|nr:PRD domain-containing protein [Elusimicrobiota bacterium]